jgi:hypothetical protein
MGKESFIIPLTFSFKNRYYEKILTSPLWGYNQLGIFAKYGKSRAFGKKKNMAIPRYDQKAGNSHAEEDPFI